MITPMYNLNITTYQQLLDSGQGVLIYGQDFPSNASVFKSEQAKYFAVMQVYNLVKDFSEASGASAADLVAFIKDYGEAIAEIESDYLAGLITDADYDDIIKELDGDNE